MSTAINATWSIAAVLLILGIALIGGGFPILAKLARTKVRMDRLLPYLNALSSGIFIGSGLLHMLPHSSEICEEVFSTHFPVAPLCAALILVAMIAVEAFLAPEGHGHGHGASIGLKSSRSTEMMRVRSEESVLSGTSVDTDPTPPTSDDEDARARVSMFLTPAFLFTALAFHSFVAGLGMGVLDITSDPVEAVTMLIAILSHKGFAAMALCSAFLNKGLSVLPAALVVGAFSFVTPVGIGTGVVLKLATAGHTRQAITGLGLASSAGTFIYVGVVELLVDELKGGRGILMKMIQVALVVAGIGVMAALALAEH